MRNKNPTKRVAELPSTACGLKHGTDGFAMASTTVGYCKMQYGTVVAYRN